MPLFITVSLVEQVKLLSRGCVLWSSISPQTMSVNRESLSQAQPPNQTESVIGLYPPITPPCWKKQQKTPPKPREHGGFNTEWQYEASINLWIHALSPTVLLEHNKAQLLLGVESWCVYVCVCECDAVQSTTKVMSEDKNSQCPLLTLNMTFVDIARCKRLLITFLNLILNNGNLI